MKINNIYIINENADFCKGFLENYFRIKQT